MSYRAWMLLGLLGLTGTASAKEPHSKSDKDSQGKCPIVPLQDPGVYFEPYTGNATSRKVVSQSDIMAVALAHKTDVKDCVKEQKKQDPSVSGKLEMTWLIRTDGSTTNVRCITPELCKTVVADCLTRLIEDWCFPQAEKQGDPIVFPFTF